MIDAKDLRPMTPQELILGGVFYLKNGDGTYSTCQIFKEETKNKARAAQLRTLTKQYCKEGRLFVRLSAPSKSFV